MKKLMNFKKEISIIFLIAVLGLVVYSNVLSGRFVWDDGHLVRDDVYIRDWAHLGNIFISNIGAGGGYMCDYYRPLQTVSYLLDYSVWELNPVGYHLTNVFLHIAASVLLFLFILMITKDRRAAAIGAILYTVHPANTAAVAYISGRADILAAIFTLLSLMAFHANFKARTAARAAVYYAASLASFMAALLSKEIAVIIPLAAASYRWFFINDVETGHSRKNSEFNYILGFIIILGAYFFLRLHGPGIQRLGMFESEYPLYLRILTFLKAIMVYIGIIFFPVGLHMERDIPYAASFLESGVLFSAIGLILTIFLIIKIKRISKEALFGVVFFFIFLLPVSNVFPMSSNLAEHWLYLPMMGISLSAAVLGTHLWDNKAMMRPILACLSVGYFMFFAYQTADRNLDWRDDFTLYHNTIKYGPARVEALNNLGNIYRDRNDYKKAAALYRKALRIDPNLADAYNSLGLICDKSGRNKEAIKFFKIAIKADPNRVQPYINLGMMYNKIGKKEEAVKLYETAIRVDPYAADSYYNLGNLYLKYGENEKAIRSYRKAILINGKDADAYNNLAVIYKNMGKLDEAARLFEKSAEIRARSPQWQ